MAFKDHGRWVSYKPVEHPKDAPPQTAFLKRESDGFDWYEYVNVEEGNEAHKGRKKQFGVGTVKCVIDKYDDGSAVVRTAAVDEARLFPLDGHLIELEVRREQDEAALIDEFCNRHFDLKSGALGERWKPPARPDPITPVLEQILARLEKLENK